MANIYNTDYEGLVKDLRSEFDSRKTRSLSWRKDQLRGLIRMFDEQEELFVRALKEDLGKPRQEAILMEIQFTRNLTTEALRNLDSWVKDEPGEKSFVTLLDSVYCHWDPYGVVLIISPWNYPLQLTLTPLVGAIAAGNCALLKPSELSNAVSLALKDILPQYVDETCFKIVLGGVPETQALLRVRFDYIFFTGSTGVGRVIAAAAAKHLTPCTLELGGKSPVYVHGDLSESKIRTVVKRILWGKMANAGQTCVAPDYLLVHKSAKNQLTGLIKDVYNEFYNDKQNEFKDQTCIVSDRHFERLESVISDMPEDKCFLRRPMNKEKRLLGLHVYTEVEPEDSIMREEIFGPILPVMTVENEEEAISFINSRPKPLSLYIFSQSSSIPKAFISRTSSGSVCVNDTVVHLSVESLPFGGVGDSGYGNYHGRYSFQCFSHKKSVLSRGLDALGEGIGAFRYPPYSDKKARLGAKVIQPISLPFGRKAAAVALGWLLSLALGFACGRLL